MISKRRYKKLAFFEYKKIIVHQEIFFFLGAPIIFLPIVHFHVGQLLIENLLVDIYLRLRFGLVLINTYLLIHKGYFIVKSWY